jgi:hypothetical protein
MRRKLTGENKQKLSKIFRTVNAVKKQKEYAICSFVQNIENNKDGYERLRLSKIAGQELHWKHVWIRDSYNKRQTKKYLRYSLELACSFGPINNTPNDSRPKPDI